MSQLTLCLVLLGGLACLSPAVSGQVCPTDTTSDVYVFELSTLSDSVHTVATEDPQLARRPALCHVVCINRVILGLPGPNVSPNSTAPSDSAATSGNGTNGTATDEEPLMPGEYRIKNCRELRRYLDCRNGCMTGSEENCGTCSGRCPALCEGFASCTLGGITGNCCGAQCDETDCGYGCGQFSSLPSDDLPKPMDPPVLTQPNQAVYDVELPMDLEMYMFNNPSFVFRIEHAPGQFVYQWMVDIAILDEITITDYLLDLSSFPGGSRVNVSFAYVSSEMGLSSYSDPVQVVLPEVCTVAALTDEQINIRHKRDTRAGFFNHPVITVSWCPTTCTSEVVSYTVTRVPLNRLCTSAGVVSATVNSTTYSVELRSENTGSLYLPCQTQIEVKTNLVGGGEQIYMCSIIVSAPHRDNFMTPQLSCPLRYDSEAEKYIVDFQFTLPFSPATLSNVAAYVVRADAYQEPAPGMRDAPAVGVGQNRQSIFPTSVERFEYGTMIELEPFVNVSRFYNISLEVGWKPQRSLVPSISTSCKITGLNALPPLPIDTISIITVDTGSVLNTGVKLQSVQATVTFEFEEPEVQFKEDTPIESYQVYFGMEKLGPTEGRTELTTIPGLRGSASNTFYNIPRSQFRVKAYIQIRTRQFRDFPSNWSVPVEVSIVALPIPSEVGGLLVKLSEVDVRYQQDKAYLVLNGSATWDKTRVPQGAVLEYRIRIGGASPFIRETELIELRAVEFILPSNYSLDLPVTITVQTSLDEEMQTSFPVTENLYFRPIPHPEDITVSFKNPRVNGTMLTVDLNIDWAHPQFEHNLTSYEIKFRTDSGSRAFDGLLDRDTKPLAPNSTQLTKNLESVVNPEALRLLVQMRSIMDTVDPATATNFLPQWSTPVSVPMITLAPPLITESQLLSFSLVSSDTRLSVTTAVQLTWEDSEDSEDLERYEVWVGERALDQFEQPAENEGLGQIVAFPVDTVNTTSENSTDSNSTASTNSTMEIVSAEFFSLSDSGIVYVQIRSVSRSEIPKWSTPAVSHRRQSTPPPDNINTVGDPVITINDQRSAVNVKVDLEWELPEVFQVEGGPTDPPPVTPEPNSVVTPPPSSSPLPSPSPSPNSPRKRQVDTEDPQSGSGSGSGMGPGDGDGPVPEPLGDIVAIYVYMGEEVLATYAARPGDVVEFKPDELSGPVDMDFDFDGKEGLTLNIQMQIVTEGGFPAWSQAQTIDVLPTQPETKGVSSNSSDPTLPIVLSVVGAVVLALIIAIAIAIICICYNRQQYKLDINGEQGMDIYSRPGLTGIYSGKGPILDEWEISTDDVIVDELLGEGAFGEVYKGVIRGPLENPKISAVLRQAIGVPVAIKLLKMTSAGKEKADFLAEIDMMKKIAEGYNTHIVNMVGCVTLQEPLCLITEFVPYGDLLSYLKQQRKKRTDARRMEKVHLQRDAEQRMTSGADEYVIATNDHSYEDTTTGGEGEGEGEGEGGTYETPETPQPAPYLEPPNAYSHLDPKAEVPEPTGELEEDDSGDRTDLGALEPDDLIRFAYQIASGMEYLASLKIVHRDLACRNVLIAKDKLLKITDFGLSREVQEVYVKKTRGRLPLKWMAIESITAREFTTSSDVWAFGVTLYEIGTIGGFPYPSINNEDLLRMLSQGYRLEKPDNCSPEVYALMLECWQEDPQDRPSFSNLRTKFSTMIQAGSPDAYIDLQINEDAPYYQLQDEERRERSDSESSGSSEGSVDSIDKEKTKKGKKVKRTRTNPYVPTPADHTQGEGLTVAEGDEGYIAMQSAGSAVERPVQLGIPISQLVPSSSQGDQQMSPAEENSTPMDSRRTNPYVSEPSEIADNSLMDSTVPLIVNDGHTGSVRDSATELTESTHL